MTNDDKVLACVDRSRCAEAVTDAAAWAARRIAAPLELLHVIDRHPPLQAAQDRSGAIGVDAQEHLLDQLSAEDETRSRAEREAGRLFLDHLRQRARKAGADLVDVRLRRGAFDETVQELRANVRLFIMGRQGAAAGEPRRDPGRHVAWALRTVDRPILVVTETFVPPRRVLFAFDGSAISRRGVATLAGSPLLRGVPIHLLMSGKAQSQGARQLESAREALQQAGLAATAEKGSGDPETVVAQAFKQQPFDLLAMGCASHSPWRAAFQGSRMGDLLRGATVPTLLLR